MRRRGIIAVVLAFLVGSLVLGQSAQVKAKKLKVAFALLWTINDLGWTTAHYRGIQYLEEKLGDQIEVAYTEKVLAADAERVLRDYAQRGFDVIFATTFEHMDPTLIVAKDFPNVAFEHCSGYKKSKNVGNYFARMYQGEYLAGYMAGLMGFKNVGTVATQPIPEPVRGINAFTIGLKKGLEEIGADYDPKAVNTVVWLKAWRDAINETTLAETLVSRGHDLIRQMADTPDSSRAACDKGVPAIGYGIDPTEYGADCALVSTEWVWGPYYVDVVKRVMNGTWKPQEYWGGFKEGNIKLSPFHADVPQWVREKVEAEKKLLMEGVDNIFAGPIKNQEGVVIIPAGKKASDQDLLTMRWLVEGVKGEIPD